MKTTLVKSLLVIVLVLALPGLLLSQNNKLKIRPVGTGQTTGHIATLNVKNNSDAAIKIQAQTFYIPSDKKYQSYVGKIPGGMVVEAGEMLPIQVMGYCTDVHKPPVAAGAAMPDLSSWIPVQMAENNWLASDDHVSIFSSTGIPAYSVEHIPNLIKGDGFIENPSVLNAPLISTWPGTDIQLSGIIQVQGNESQYAPLIVDAVSRIEKASYKLIDEGLIHTPFSANQSLESEALIQQTIWIYLGLITGENYDKEDFENQLIAQYENNTNTKIEDASDETVAKLETGVDDFWSSFELVGVEAKVISVQSGLANGIKEGMEKAMGGSKDNSGVKAVSDGTKAASNVAAGATAKGNKIALDSVSRGTSNEDHEVVHVHQGPASAVAKGSSSAGKADLGAAGAGAEVGKSAVAGEGATATAGGNGSAEAANPGENAKKGKYDGITKKEDLHGQLRQQYEQYEQARKQGATHDAASKKAGLNPESDEAKALERVFKTEMHIN